MRTGVEEGKRYDFLVEKKILMGQNSYFLLKGPDDKKFLLAEEHYNDYDIRINEIINCRVDKINCRGEVFLEPEHPYYSEGLEYDFRITGKDTRIDGAGDIIPVLLVKDVSGRELSVPMNSIPLSQSGSKDYVRLRVKRINKGKISFTGTSPELKDTRKEESIIHNFLVKDIMPGVDGKDYYLVEDNENVHHIIPVRQYSYYGLEPGKKFKGRYISYHKTGKYKVEPVNPYYEPGKTYEFKLYSESVKPDGGGKVLILNDKHGLSHQVIVPMSFKSRKKMLFKVEKIRKGWPLLVKP